jgi:hypothetical protein
MSAFEKAVRANAAMPSTGLLARALGMAESNSPAELVELAAAATIAHRTLEERARAAHVEETGRKRGAVAQWGAEQGLADSQGNVSRLAVKRAVKAQHPSAASVPATPPTAPPEPRRRYGGVIVPEPGEILRGHQHWPEPTRKTDGGGRIP